MKDLKSEQGRRFDNLKERILVVGVKKANAHIADTTHDLGRWPDLADDILDDFEQTVKYYEEKLTGELRQSTLDKF